MVNSGTFKLFVAVFSAWGLGLCEGNVLRNASNHEVPLENKKSFDHLEKSSLSSLDLRSLPCPNEADISPCLCSFDGVAMNIDCSLVKDMVELKTVFQADFPFTSFTSLVIDNNPKLTGVLPNDAFGPVEFERITITNTGLDGVADSAFENSVSRLETLNLMGNAFVDFPVSNLISYIALKNLDLKNNGISTLPDLYSSTLEYLNLDNNPLTMISPTTFANIRYLQRLYLNNVGLSEVPVGVFDSLDNLQELYLIGNSIQTLRSGTFRLNSDVLTSVVLAGNAITDVEANAFVSGLSNTVNLDFRYNTLTELPQSVWRPITTLLGPLSLHIDGNDLNCGCSICWLMKDSVLLSHTSGGHCSSGEALEDVNADYCDLFCFRDLTE